MKKATWFVFFLIMAVSCLDEPDCFRQNINLISISFKKMYDGKADTVIIYKATAAGFSKLFRGDTIASNLPLPLNYLENETTFNIEGYDGFARAYTLRLGYKSKSQFVSEDCGQKFIVSNLQILGATGVDSIRLVSDAPSNPPNVNIEIYRCPRNNIMRLNFRQLYMDTVKLGKADPRTINSISLSGIKLNEESIVSSNISLPLDPNNTSTTYIFDLDNDEVDTISFSYNTIEKTVLSKCGPQLLISKLDTIDSTFPLLRIANDSIYDPPRTNVEILRCPVTDNIQVLFRQLRGSSPVSDTLQLTSLNADFTSEPIYIDTAVTSVILPLNPLADISTYTFTNDDGASNTLQVTYKREVITFHQVCGPQTRFTEIIVSASDFVTQAVNIIDAQAKFPTVNNIEIIQ